MTDQEKTPSEKARATNSQGDPLYRLGNAGWERNPWVVEDGLEHEMLYSDPKRVARARVQAEGRIGARKLRQILIEPWAIPILDWLTDRLPQRWGR